MKKLFALLLAFVWLCAATVAADASGAAEENQEELYNQAMTSYESGDYEAAVQLFSRLGDFREAEEYAALSQIAGIGKEFEEIGTELKAMTRLDYLYQLKSLQTRLALYKAYQQADELNRKINYAIGKYYGLNNSYSEAVEYLENAGGFDDTDELKLQFMVKYLESMLDSGMTEQAKDYYRNTLKPAGYEKEIIAVRPGDQGIRASALLSLLKTMGINKKIRAKEDTYKQEYLQDVQALERELGLSDDGSITLEEYFDVTDVICTNARGENVRMLLEKLADLSYISNLPTRHSTYEAKYTNAVKKAEKDLGLKPDGIITRAEYSVIMDQKVDPPEAPADFRAEVTKDKVTLTWSKVPGALAYIVKSDSGTSKTNNNRWTENFVETGVTKTYSVRAVKNSTAGEEAFLIVEIPLYYKLLDAATLRKNYTQLKGSSVRMANMGIRSLRVKTPRGIFSTKDSDFEAAREQEGYDLYILCGSGKTKVEFVIENYAARDWGSDGRDPIAMRKKIRSVSVVEGIVQSRLSGWDTDYTIPSILVHSITWK